MTDERDLLDPDTYLTGVPYAAFARLRSRAAVSWVEEPDGGPGFWGVWRHAECRQVLRAPQVFSSHLGATQIRDPATPEDLEFVRRSMLNMDPPEHSRLRRLVAGALTPRAVAALTGRINGYARSLVEAADDECDLAVLAADLPLWTLADLLGVPESDRYLLFDWASRVIGFQDTEYAAIERVDRTTATDMARAALTMRPRPGPDGRMPDPRTRGGIPDLYAYAHALALAKRRSPGNDIMSTVLSGVDDDRVTVAEFENLFWLFSVAGNETLRNGIPGGMVALLEHPAQWRLLAHDRSLLPRAVDEMLRWWSPVVHFRRTATRDTTLAGQPIGAGQKVVVFFASANRDPAVFADPDTFDVAAARADHLAFGHGPHFCLGAQLGRAQMTALFAAVLDRWGQAVPEPAGPMVRLRSTFQNGVKHLPVRFGR